TRANNASLHSDQVEKINQLEQEIREQTNRTNEAEAMMEPFVRRRTARLVAIAQAEERYRAAIEVERQQIEEEDILAAQRARAHAALQKRVADPKAHWQNAILKRDPISKVTKHDQENVRLTRGPMPSAPMVTTRGIMEIYDDGEEVPIDPALRMLDNNCIRNDFGPVGGQL
ncbi:4061_t:CDS:1, partial [Acaulospora colombiana]